MTRVGLAAGVSGKSTGNIISGDAAHAPSYTPLLIPSITTGALLVFIAAFTDLGTPIILGERFRVLPVLIYGEFVNEFGGRPVLASALSVVLLAVTTGALLLQRWLSARFAPCDSGRASA